MERIFEENFTKKDLQDICFKWNLSTGGLKGDIARRIVKFLMENQTSVPVSTTAAPITPLIQTSRITFFQSFKLRFPKWWSWKRFKPSISMPAIHEVSANFDFGQIIARLSSVLGILGGIYALIQLYNSSFDSKVEIVVPGHSYFW